MLSERTQDWTLWPEISWKNPILWDDRRGKHSKAKNSIACGADLWVSRLEEHHDIPCIGEEQTNDEKWTRWSQSPRHGSTQAWEQTKRYLNDRQITAKSELLIADSVPNHATSWRPRPNTSHEPVAKMQTYQRFVIVQASELSFVVTQSCTPDTSSSDRPRFIEGLPVPAAQDSSGSHDWAVSLTWAPNGNWHYLFFIIGLLATMNKGKYA